MKSDMECLMCMLKQALNTVRLITDDETLQREVMNRVAEFIPQANMKLSPAIISKPAYEIVSAVTGVKDPFLKIKQQTNEEALKLLPALKQLVKTSHDPLNTALHIAVAGNIIDIGIGHKFDLTNDVKKILQTDFAIDHSEKFKNQLQTGKKLLYLGDNAGEIVFDRILVEYLMEKGLDVTFSVNSEPIINDATMVDAESVGLTQITHVIETGADDIGINFDRISDEFRMAFESADIIISKGHGNFETCSGKPHNIFFLLKAKCDVVAKELGVKFGDIVFKSEH